MVLPYCFWSFCFSFCACAFLACACSCSLGPLLTGPRDLIGALWLGPELLGPDIRGFVGGRVDGLPVPIPTSSGRTVRVVFGRIVITGFCTTSLVFGFHPPGLSTGLLFNGGKGLLCLRKTLLLGVGMSWEGVLCLWETLLSWVGMSWEGVLLPLENITFRGRGVLERSGLPFGKQYF